MVHCVPFCYLNPHTPSMKFWINPCITCYMLLVNVALNMQLPFHGKELMRMQYYTNVSLLIEIAN